MQERHRPEESRQGSASGSFSRPLSPPHRRRVSPGHDDHNDRAAPVNAAEHHRLDRNRIDIITARNDDEYRFEEMQKQIKGDQEQAREKERQRTKAKEERSKLSKRRESSPEDKLESLRKKSDLPAEENGSSSRANGTRSHKSSSGWSYEEGEEGEQSRRISSNGGHNGHRYDRDYIDADYRGSYHHEHYRDSRDYGRSDHTDEERRRRRREREFESRGHSDYEEEEYRRRSHHDSRSDHHSYDRYRDYDSRYADRERHPYRERDSHSWRDEPRSDREHRRPSHSHHSWRDEPEEEREDRRRSHHSSRLLLSHSISHRSSREEGRASGPDTETSSRIRDEPSEVLPTKTPEALPVPPPETKLTTPPPPPVILSFKPVKLPHELLEPEHAALIPTASNGKKLTPYRTTTDFELVKDKTKDQAAKKELVRKTEIGSDDVDPRDKTKKRSVKDLKVVKYKWDQHSVKQPSCVILMIGASAILTATKVRQHFSLFGKIAEMEQKYDQVGQSLGIFTIRYVQDYLEENKLKPDVKEKPGQRGDMIAMQAVQESQGQPFFNESIKVTLDDNDKRQYHEVYEAEMAKIKQAKMKKVEAQPVIPPSIGSASPSTNGAMQPPLIPKGPRSDSLLGANLHPTPIATQHVRPFATKQASNFAPLYNRSTTARHLPSASTAIRANGTGQAHLWYNSALTSPPKAPKRAAKSSWSEEELFADSKLLILRELGETFMRDLKTRTINAYLKQFMHPDSVGGQAIRRPVVAEKEAEDPESESETRRNKVSRRGRLLEEERDRVGVTPDSTERSEISPSEEEEEMSVAESAAGDVEKVKKKKTKEIKKTHMVDSDDVDELVADMGIVVAPTIVRSKAKKAAVKKTKEQSPAADPISLGLAEDEEDMYYLRLALERVKSGTSLVDLQAEQLAAIEAAAEIESGQGVNGLPRHESGSARTEGVYRIPPAQKAVHMPDRNRAAVDSSALVGLTSARGNRADSRRFVQGIEQHKKETATDTDILKFNQLRSRKKQLKFSKSPIHDWGLYAVELIPAGDMVIEYVGEIVRQQVADQREKMYERQGNFSTYLFRVDDDVVVDATKKGNIARLMNHCCTPNCTAKILTLNGEKRIVIFAQKPILPGQELTYDYKFQATGDEEDAIACLCGSPGCRRFL